MLRLGQHTEFPQLVIQFFHESCDFRLDRSEIVVVKFLPFWRHHPEQGPPGESQIRPLFIEFVRDQEIFLLSSRYRLHPPDRIIAKYMKHSQSLPVQSIHGSKKRCLFIHRLSAV